MGEAEKYRQGDPEQQFQNPGQSQYQYQNQAPYNQGYNNNNNNGYNPGAPPYNPAYNSNQQPVNGQYQDHPYGPPPPYSFNPPQPNDEKYSFNDAFKLEKPKYNDLWAGLLVRYRDCLTHACMS